MLLTLLTRGRKRAPASLGRRGELLGMGGVSRVSQLQPARVAIAEATVSYAAGRMIGRRAAVPRRGPPPAERHHRTAAAVRVGTPALRRPSMIRARSSGR